MKVASVIFGLFLTVSSAAYAGEGDVDYDALTQKVQKSVYIHQHKRGVSLNGPATHSLLVQSFLGQLVKAPLTELGPHLFFACGMPDLYDDKTLNLEYDSGIQVNKSQVFLFVREGFLKAKFPTKDGMKLKKVMKIDGKKMKFFRDHWDRNEYLPQTANEYRGEVNPWVSDTALVADVRGNCDAALQDAIEPHKEPFQKFIDRTINTNVKAAVK